MHIGLGLLYLCWLWAASPASCREVEESDAVGLMQNQLTTSKSISGPDQLLVELEAITGTRLLSLEHAEQALQGLAKSGSKLTGCDTATALVQQLIKDLELEQSSAQRSVMDASSFGKCQRGLVQELSAVEASEALWKLVGLREKAEACVGGANACTPLVTAMIDILGNATSDDMKAAAQSLAKVASSQKVDGVMSSFDTFASLAEKDIKKALDSTVAKKFAEATAQVAAQTNAKCLSALDALSGRLEDCKAISKAKHETAVALCREPPSCEEYIKTAPACLSTIPVDHLELSIKRDEEMLLKLEAAEAKCANATGEAAEAMAGCDSIALQVTGKQAECNPPSPCGVDPCDVTSTTPIPLPVFNVSGLGPCDVYEANKKACLNYDSCYGAALGAREILFKMATARAERSDPQYRQLKRLACLLVASGATGPVSIEECEAKACKATLMTAMSPELPYKQACDAGSEPEDCCHKKLTCGAFTCPRGYNKKNNAGSIYNYSLGGCCDQTCGEFLCPAGYDQKLEPFSIIGHCKFKCCNEGCGLFSCPAGTVKKTDLTGVRGFCPETCCDKTCATITCPNGTELKNNPVSIKASTKQACCKPTCQKYTCPQGYRKTGLDISGYSTEECCSATCDTVSCPRGFVRALDHATQRDVNERSCCDATCDAFACPDGHVKKPNVAGLKEFSAQACCDATCDVVACPAGTRDNHSMAGVVAPLVNRTSACCSKLCSVFSCPSGYNLKSAAADIEGKCRFKCCDEGCGMFMCPPGTLKKENLTDLAGFSPQACCDLTCARFQCPQGFQQVQGAGNIREYSQDVCCEQTCGMFECPAGHSKKADDVKGRTADECCTMTCDTLSCDRGFVKKDLARSSVLDVSHTSCCEGTCDAYSCSAGSVKKHGVEGLRQFSDEACCDATCDDYECPDGYNLVASSGSILQPSAATCCESSCNLFTCPQGFLPVSNSSISGFSRDACCEQTCTAVTCDHGCLFECPTGWTLKPDADNIRGGTASLCCDLTCASMTRCTKEGYELDPSLKDAVCGPRGCNDDSCCLEVTEVALEEPPAPTCASMRACKKEGYELDVSDDAACFEAVTWAMTDGILSNPEWYPGLSSRSSRSQFRAHLETVDVSPCFGKLSGKVCPPGGCSDETCCKPTCASFQCTRPGFRKISENHLCPPGGCAEDVCCKADAPKCVPLPERFMYCKSKTGTYDKPEVPLCVTLAEGDASAGKLELAPCQVGDASIDQQFVLNHTDSQIHWFKDPTKCLEVKVFKNGTVQDEAKVTLADCQDPCEVRKDPTKQGFCFDVLDGQYKVIKSSCFGEASLAAPAAFDTNRETPHTKCLQIKNGRAKEGWTLRVSDCKYEETDFGKDHDQCWEYIDLYRKCADCAPIALPPHTGWTETPMGGVDCIAQASGGQCAAQIGSNSSTSCGSNCCCDNHPWSCQTDSFTCGCYHTLMTCPVKKKRQGKGSRKKLGKKRKGKGSQKTRSGKGRRH